MKIRKVAHHSSQYPHKLRSIPDAPKELFILGDLGPLLDNPCLTVIGARKASPYGRGVTTQLVSTIAARGITIISGLALGIDAIAHQAALDTGGKTIAVLPCGLDKPYPASHRQLARRILEQGGALISEYPETTPPLKHHFVARNRIVSGLGDAILITEAAAKSGTMHTVGFALDQGKTVMAVPGSITSELSEGTNNLIKIGATPVTGPQDILDTLGIGEQLQLDDVLAANEQEEAILSLLKEGVTDGSELQIMSKLDPSEFNQTLTMLEVTGKICATGANHWAISSQTTSAHTARRAAL